MVCMVQMFPGTKRVSLLTNELLRPVRFELRMMGLVLET